LLTKTKRLFSGFYLLFYCGMGVFVTLLPIYLNELGLNKGEIGLIMAAGPLATIIGPPLWGYTADHIRDKKKVLLLCLVGSLVVSLYLTKFQVVAALLPIYFLYNFFQSGPAPLADSFVLCSLESSYFGNIRLWGSIGFAGGALLCGQMLGYLPSSSLFLLYFVVGFTALAFGFLMPPDEANRHCDEGIHLRDVYKLILNKQFSLLMLIILLVMIPYGAYCSFLSLYLKEVGATPFQIGLAWTIAALAEVPLLAWGARWLRPNRAWVLLGLAAAIFGLRWVIYGIWGNHILIMLLQLLQSVSFGLFLLVSVQLVNCLTPRDLKAVGQTVFSSVSYGLSFVIGSLLGGYVAMRYGFGVLFLWAGVLSLIGGVVTLIASTKLSRAILKEE
jgi:MFS transporter, PPP family, 3-phenylpropionic acid transporter